MTLVGLTGILLGFLSILWAMAEKENRKLGLLVLIMSIHVGTSVLYYMYVQSNDADTKLYYYDPYGFYRNKFSLGTVFVIHMVQWLRDKIGGTYLDYFLVFQAIGVWGIVLLVRTLEELTLVLKRPWPPLLTILVLMPGMFFWTSAIGKDAPLFLASSLAVWSSMAIGRRWPWFALAVAIMVLFRPHVALVAVAALAIALVAGRGVPIAVRLLLVGITGVAGAILAGTVQSSLQVDLASVSSIANFVETQTSVAADAASEEALGSAPFPIKLISLLYRPFFADAEGLMGLIASVQNIFMVFATYLLLREFRTWRLMFRESLPMRFATFYMVAMILMLTVMYYNVGLGLRQREMFTPALYFVFAALYMVTRDKRMLEEQPGRTGSRLAEAGR